MSVYAIAHCVLAAIVAGALLGLSSGEDHSGVRYYQRLAAFWAVMSILWAVPL